MFLKRIVGLTILTLSLNVYAIEPVAKEDLTPPPPEGALSADKIPPILTAPAPSKTPPPASATQPAMPTNPMMAPPTAPSSAYPTTAPATGTPTGYPTPTPPGSMINTQPTQPNTAPQ